MPWDCLRSLATADSIALLVTLGRHELTRHPSHGRQGQPGFSRRIVSAALQADDEHAHTGSELAMKRSDLILEHMERIWTSVFSFFAWPWA